MFDDDERSRLSACSRWKLEQRAKGKARATEGGIYCGQGRGEMCYFLRCPSKYSKAQGDAGFMWSLTAGCGLWQVVD